MAERVKLASVYEQEIVVARLQLDRNNPRMPSEFLQADDDIVRLLIDEFDVDELVQSILASGWIDYEPLIVQNDTLVVFEGNRRLAALRLIADATLRTRVQYRLPSFSGELPDIPSVRVRLVADRSEARRFIAFKHINGPYKWDAFAKAKYAADWLESGESISEVSRMLGDNHNTIRRLVLGYSVLQQSQSLGFALDKRTKRHFSFSHLYTAISRPAVRGFLGLEDQDVDAKDKTSANPVPEANGKQLLELMSWLYGQEDKKEPAVVLSQNPNLNQLVKVIEVPEALAALRHARRLDIAFEQVEPATDRFREALLAASRQCENALKLSSYWDGDETLLSIATNTLRTVRSLRKTMIDRSTSLEDDHDD